MQSQQEIRIRIARTAHRKTQDNESKQESPPNHIGMARRLATNTEAAARREETVRLVLGMTGLGDAVTAAARLHAIATDDAKAVTDEQGGFVLPRRLPPGRYQATAARQGNPFLMVVDHNKTKQEFTVGSGMTEYPIHFQITSQ